MLFLSFASVLLVYMTVLIEDRVLLVPPSFSCIQYVQICLIYILLILYIIAAAVVVRIAVREERSNVLTSASLYGWRHASVHKHMQRHHCVPMLPLRRGCLRRGVVYRRRSRLAGSRRAPVVVPRPQAQLAQVLLDADARPGAIDAPHEVRKWKHRRIDVFVVIVKLYTKKKKNLKIWSR